MPPAIVAPSLALSAYYFVYFAYVGAYSPYFTLYLRDLGLAAAQIGVLYAIPQVMRIFGPAAWGALADRSGAPVVIVRVAAVLSAACFALLYAGGSFAWIFAVLVAMHFFTSAQMPVVEAVTLNHVRDRPGMYGRIRVWGSIGFIAAVLALGALLDRVPTTAVLHATAAMLALSAVAAFLIPARTGRAPAGPRGGLAAILGQRRVRAFLAACLLNGFAHAALYAFYSIHLAARGYTTTAIGILWAAGVLIEIAVFQAMPQLLRRHDPSVLFASTFGVCAVRFLIIGWGVGSWWLLLAAQLMHAATFAIYHASAVALVGRYFGSEHQARGQGLYASLSFGAGGFAGGIVSGLAWDALGAGWTFTISAVAGALGLALLTAGGQPGVAGSR